MISTTPSKFVWYELLTPDMPAAAAFYRKIIGWDIKDSGMPGTAYSIASAGESMIGGLTKLTDDMRAMHIPRCWSGYIGVDDVDAMAQKVTAYGGAVRRGPDDIPGVGRFAVVTDPHGAAFIIFKSSGMMEPKPAPMGTPGIVAWHELHAGDRETDFAFYAGLFGWTKTDAIDMGGDVGTYQTFKISDGQAGGIMTRMPKTPGPFWLYYFMVDAIDAAVTRVRDAGGSVVHGPVQVPGGGWIATCFDPQGAGFALFSMSKG
jgi:predicted enzyme related to lactoylglutathione lyase